MKNSIVLILSIVYSLFVFTACTANEPCVAGKSDLIFKSTVIFQTNQKDTVVFLGSDIKWFKESTGELRFVNSSTVDKIKSFHRIKFYLGNDLLFTATVALDIMSVIINDLVIHINHSDGLVYLEDGYPMWTDNLGETTLRAQNKSKRAKAWSQFIDQLKKEGRYRSL